MARLHMQNNLTSLHDLRPGQKGRIGQLVGRPDHVHRLEELGFLHGSSIEMVRSGNTCIVRLSGAKLCFRQNDALGVLVHVGHD